MYRYIIQIVVFFVLSLASDNYGQIRFLSFIIVAFDNTVPKITS